LIDPTDAPSVFGAASWTTSIPWTIGFWRTLPKSMSRFVSLATVNVLTTPLNPPTSANTS
jgi:hypothetical protein